LHRSIRLRYCDMEKRAGADFTPYESGAATKPEAAGLWNRQWPGQALLTIRGAEPLSRSRGQLVESSKWAGADG
jgi:hypothetical protein